MGRTATPMAILVAALVAALPALADFEAGRRAWDAGDMDEAPIRWQAPAREAGKEAAVVALTDGNGRAELEAEDRRRAHPARKWPRGRKLRDCEACPELVVVPAGHYEMGAPPGEEGRNDAEGPVHGVTISKPFAVGVYEVTRGEWSRFVSETGYSGGNSCSTYAEGAWKERSGRGWRAPGYAQDDGHPVVCVSWGDAKAYVEWLSRKTGKEYRLLSESEWEYAARGRTGTSRWWGGREGGQCRHANGADRSVERLYPGWTVASCDDGHVHTAPGGTFEANGYGLHDVLGNVWEWVEDCWHDDYRGAPTDGSAWIRGGECAKRVLRGGSWNSQPWILRSAIRGEDPTGNRTDYDGFRVARTLTP